MNIFRNIISGLLALLLQAAAHADETIRIGYLDQFSGPTANVGVAFLRAARVAIDTVNARGGVLGGRRLELVPLDSKGSPQDALSVFRSATDQGLRYIASTAGSHIAAAMIEAINKHNARNPDATVLYLNTGAIDPTLTNEKCSFWHFRFDADVDMKMSALTDAIAATPGIRKVYLINQDYAFGQAVARAARRFLQVKRPDIEIVGDELHPLSKVKDFAPYVAKMKASGADTVITGNWGPDMTLLVKASREFGFAPDFYTYYAGALGTPPALGDAGLGHLRQVTNWHVNIGGERADRHTLEYREKFKEAKDDLSSRATAIAVEMLALAMERTKSTDPKKVATAMEGMNLEDDSGEVFMRADNHQLIQPLYVSTYSKVDGKAVKYDVERTGNGFKTEHGIEGKNTVLPTTCKMQRPE